MEGIGADSPATTGLLEPDLADQIVAVSDADAHAARPGRQVSGGTIRR